MCCSQQIAFERKGRGQAKYVYGSNFLFISQFKHTMNDRERDRMYKRQKKKIVYDDSVKTKTTTTTSTTSPLSSSMMMMSMQTNGIFSLAGFAISSVLAETAQIIIIKCYSNETNGISHMNTSISQPVIYNINTHSLQGNVQCAVLVHSLSFSELYYLLIL